MRSAYAVVGCILTGIVFHALLLLQLGGTVYGQFRNAVEDHGVTAGRWIMQLCAAVHLHLQCLRSSAQATNSKLGRQDRDSAADACSLSATVAIYY